jgi:hypothetical protein
MNDRRSTDDRPTTDGGHPMPTTTTTLGSILLASTDPDRLRAWYQKAFGVTARDDGFLEIGDVAVLIDRRDDVADRTAEPGRTILNFHVVEVEGNYPSKRSHGERAFWVRDSEGNLLGIGQPLPRTP